MLRRTLIIAVCAAAAVASAAARGAPADGDGPSLTLYSGVGFQGRQVTFRPGAARRVSPGFKARSAFSSGPWSVCDGSGPASHCQSLNGAAAVLKVEPRVVRLIGPAPAPAAAPARSPRTAAPAQVRRASAPVHRALPVRAAPRIAAPAHRRRRAAERAPELTRAAVSRPYPDEGPREAAAPAQERLGPLPADAEPIAYSCRDGRSLTALFDPDRGTVEILAGGEQPVTLARTASPRGFRYESWGRAFYGDGEEAAYQVAGADRLDCWAEPPGAGEAQAGTTTPEVSSPAP